MKTSKINSALASFILIAITLLAACSSENKATSTVASPSTYQADIHYEKFSNVSLSTVKTSKATVSEFFWYGCSHCQQFSPLLSEWATKNTAVNVQYIPVIWNETTQMHAQIFFLIQDKENFAALHKAMFSIIADIARIKTPAQQTAALIAQLENLGIPANETTEAIKNTAYPKAIAAVLVDMKNYKISGVPTLIINQQYKVLNPKLKSMEESLQVAEILLMKKSN